MLNSNFGNLNTGSEIKKVNPFVSGKIYVVAQDMPQTAAPAAQGMDGAVLNNPNTANNTAPIPGNPLNMNPKQVNTLQYWANQIPQLDKVYTVLENNLKAIQQSKSINGPLPQVPEIEMLASEIQACASAIESLVNKISTIEKREMQFVQTQTQQIG